MMSFHIDWMLTKWRDIEARGGTPFIRKRRFWGVEDKGPADPIPDDASSVSLGRPRRFRHQTHFQIGISDFTEYVCTLRRGHPHRQGSATTMSRP
jgi:hypothetical protein